MDGLYDVNTVFPAIEDEELALAYPFSLFYF